MMRNVQQVGLPHRLAEWIERISDCRKPPMRAGDLYAGDHWQIAAHLPALAAKNGFVPRLWIISAGYGLISADDPVQPYAAAFSPGHLDCVVHPRHPTGVLHGFEEWWKGMAAWEGPVAGQARTMAELIRRKPDSTYMIIASELYLKATWTDLLEAGNRLSDAGRLLIVSAGMKDFGVLARHAIPLDARMQAKLGGARRSLNVRMAKMLLGWLTPETEISSVRERCRREIEGQPQPVTAHRDKCSDEELMSFISHELKSEIESSSTKLLNRLRKDRQLACEQKRFSKLYHRVLESRIA